MKKVRLSGRYLYNKASYCAFEDIHLFLRMSESAKGSCGRVEVAAIDIGTVLFSSYSVKAWRIVKKCKSNKLVIAVRYSDCREKYPVIYDVVSHKKTGEPVLVRRNVSKWEALQLYYDYSLD